MYRFFFKFFATILTILTANLLTTALSDYMVTYKNNYKPVVFTIIGMVIIVMVFYPLFMRLEEWIKSVSQKVMRSGKSVAGKFLGLSLTFIAAIMVLIYFYAKMWYHIDLFGILIHGNIGNYL
jgi:hypothetical protein